MKGLSLMDTISVVIPVYLDSGLPFEMLEDTVNSVLLQNHPPVEIILSDDSNGTTVKNWVYELSKTTPLPIIYLRNQGLRGVSSNSNFAAKHARGNLIHFLHSDDHLIGGKVYSQVIEAFEDESTCWLLLSGQMKGTVTVPSLEDLNLFGVNTVGGPSGLVIKKSIFEEFDEHVSLLMDIEFFLRTWKKFGIPSISKVVSIEYGAGDWQLTKSIDEEKYCLEIDYLWKNQRIGFPDFNRLLLVTDSWNIKRSAFAYISSRTGLGKIKRLQAIMNYKFKASKFRVGIMKTSLQRRIFQQR